MAVAVVRHVVRCAQPVAAIGDVDNDGSTEIIVASNDYGYPGWRGISVIGDANASWAPARPIWNQYAYHITNVNNDGSIPTEQVQNWGSWNNFRAGGTELGPSNWLPDLAFGAVDICTETCDRDEVTLSFSVINNGLIGANDVSVSLYKMDGSIMQHSVLNIDAGAGVYNEALTISKDEWGASLLAIIDEANLITECNESNNTQTFTAWPCDE